MIRESTELCYLFNKEYKIELGAKIADKVRARLLERLIKADYVKPVHFLG